MASDLEATVKSYLNEWQTLFGIQEREEFMYHLKQSAFEGDLRSCNFRSVCWRIFLGCLPWNLKEWEDTLNESRKNYIAIKELHVTQPCREGEKDLQVENPLSQSDQSSWRKYFSNNELMKAIERDVRRTFPEMEYFHSESVRKLLVNVLFCYAQEYKELSYRQGMHELLAPLVFVVHCDLQAACHTRSIGKVEEMIDIVLDEGYLEHDSYAMFCKLMESTNPWYSVAEKKHDIEKSPVADTQRLFQPQELNTGSGSTLAVNNKLNYIYNNLLVQHDLQLQCHLNRLEIIPQVFGLRWIRLLFGREFSLQDLLVLWDSIFADSESLDLVDYLFVAMLIHIRHHLLNSDYSTCMQILMKYPPVADISDIVKAAVEIRMLKENSFSEKHPEVTSIRVAPVQSAGKKTSVPVTKQNSLTKLFKDFTKKVGTSSNPSTLPSPQSSLTDPTYAGFQKQHNRPNSSRKTLDKAAEQKRVPSQKAEINSKMSSLEKELQRMKDLCTYCGRKIESNLNILESNIKLCPEESRDDLQNENMPSPREQILLAVANLKQVRDFLEGNLTFGTGFINTRHSQNSDNTTRKGFQNGLPVKADAGDSKLLSENTNKDLS